MMKKTLLTALWALSLASLFAQTKPSEYGFSLKGGNYTVGKNRPLQYTYVPVDQLYHPGYCLAAGGYGKYTLGRWLALSGELMFSFAEFRVSQTKVLPIFEPVQGFITHYEKLHEIERYVAYHVSLPICLHFGRGLRPKFGGYIGVAPMYNLETTRSFKWEYLGAGDIFTQPEELEFDRFSGSGDPRLQWLLSAGLECSLGQRYTFGLQMLFNPKQQDPMEYYGQYQVPMKSLSATLRHCL